MGGIQFSDRRQIRDRIVGKIEYAVSGFMACILDPFRTGDAHAGRIQHVKMAHLFFGQHAITIGIDLRTELLRVQDQLFQLWILKMDDVRRVFA